MRWDTNVPAGRWNRLLKEDRRREAEQRHESEQVDDQTGNSDRENT